MRLNGPPPWDFIASALISLLALVLADLSSSSMRGLSTILGFVSAALFGYLLVLSLFPEQSELSFRTRALLSIGVSTFLIAIVSLVLIPRGLQLNYATTILSFLTLFMSAIAYARWSALPRRRRFNLWSTRCRRPRRTPASSLIVGARDCVVCLLSPLGSLTRALLSLVAGTFLAAFAYIRWIALPHRNGSAARSMRSYRSRGSLVRPPLGIRGQFVSLLLILVIIGALAVTVFTNNANHSLFTEKVQKGDPATPYREDQLWINSYNTKSYKLNNFSDTNASANSTPTTLEHNDKVVVMEVNNSSSSGNSTISEEKPSSNETAGISSLASSNEIQTTNPESQQDRSKEDLALSSSQPAEISNDKVPSPESNNTVGDVSNRTENIAIEINTSHENKSEISRIPSSESSKENRTANPESQQDRSKEDLALSSSQLAVSSNGKVPSPGANNATDHVSNLIEKTVIKTDTSHENKAGIFRENQTYNYPSSIVDLRPDKSNPQIVGSTIIWTAKASDTDGDLVLYKFLINDQPTTVWTRFNTFSWVTTKMTPGDYRIKVLVRDGKHASENAFDDSKEETFTLIQPNRIPILKDIRPDLSSPQASGKSIIWTAKATDSDNDRIFYKFFLNDEAVTGWSASNSWTWNTSSFASEDYRIKVLIRDGRHASENAFDGSKEETFTLIQPNRIPVLKDIRPDLNSPQAPGTSIIWTANATDSDKDRIFYKFLLNDNAMVDWSASNSWTWNTSSFASGDYRIKALIRDGKHASEDSFDDTKEVTFTLGKPNQIPVLKDIRPDLDSPQVLGKSIVWTADATDPDGDVIVYRFLLDDKAITGWSASNSWTWNTSSVAPGDHIIKVLIRDGKHASENAFDGSKEQTFTLTQPNQIPVLKDLRPDWGSPQVPGKSILWTANAADPDGDMIFYKFLLDDKAMVDWSASNSWTWNTSSVAPGDYRIKVLINDGKHASEDSFDGSKEVKFTLTQPNHRPVLEDIRSDLDSPQVLGKSIVWTAIATDQDGDVIVYRFLLDDKAITGWSASNSWTWNTSSVAPGDHIIKVLIRDGKHASENAFDGSKEETFTLIQPNRIPVLKDLRPDWGSPQAAGKRIAWTANAADPDGDVIFYKFLLDDKAITGWSSSNSWVWNTSSVAPGDYRIKVLIRDGKHASENEFDDSKEQTFTLIKPNHIPVLKDIRPDLSSPQVPGKSIVWTADATDPDGDMIFYKFLLDDKAMTDWSASNLWAWYTHSAAPGDYRIKVLIRDGKHESEDSFDASKETAFTLLTSGRSTVLKDPKQDIHSPQASQKASSGMQMLPTKM